MRHYFILILISLGLNSCQKESKASKEISETELTGNYGTFENNQIIVENEVRNYRLVVSSKLNLNQTNALIIAFHGLGIDSKDLMPVYSNLNQLAEKMNAIIVYPSSQNGSWGLNQKQIDKDLKFYQILVQKLKLGYKIDEKKIHITGMSNGAYFCHIVAKNNSETIASVAAHSGMIGLEFILGINAKRKYPVLLIHGVNDPIFNISTARNDELKYKNEKHKAHLIEVKNLGHEWANKINVNDSIYKFFNENPLP
jgi:polyhydroxybutyrate depolymerase